MKVKSHRIYTEFNFPFYHPIMKFCMLLQFFTDIFCPHPSEQHSVIYKLIFSSCCRFPSRMMSDGSLYIYQWNSIHAILALQKKKRKKKKEKAVHSVLCLPAKYHLFTSVQVQAQVISLPGRPLWTLYRP